MQTPNRRYPSSLSQVILTISALTTSCWGFETNHESSQQSVTKSVLKKYDKNNDKVIDVNDKGEWEQALQYDSNKDKQITKEEISENFEAFFPKIDVTVQRGIVYKVAGGEKVIMDIYFPKESKAKLAPVFYFTHGGGWQSGSEIITDGHLLEMFTQLLAKGVVCVSANYRHVKTWRQQDKVLIRDCVIDSRDGLRFLKKHASEFQVKLDMSRVVTYGPSAGGHIAVMLNWMDEKSLKGEPSLEKFHVQPAASISWFGPTDFRDGKLFLPPEGVHKQYDWDHWSKRVSKTEGVYASKDPQIKKMLAEVSPVVYLNKNSRPHLQVHGDRDNVIPVNHAYHLKEASKKVNPSVEVLVVEGGTHGINQKNSKPTPEEIKTKTVQFALKHLQP